LKTEKEKLFLIKRHNTTFECEVDEREKLQKKSQRDGKTA
jgi:hypothetical protein